MHHIMQCTSSLSMVLQCKVFWLSLQNLQKQGSVPPREPVWLAKDFAYLYLVLYSNCLAVLYAYSS